MAQQIKAQIRNGSSREDLRDSLGSKPNQRTEVEFQLGPIMENKAELISFPDWSKFFLRAVINGLEWKDGSGVSFNVSGYSTHIIGKNEPIQVRFKAHYNTETRTGMMTFAA